jgi:(2R)-sulfolactate sulfo-lyase subunit alpha
MMDKRFVLLSGKDNVLVCCGKLLAGETICLEGANVTLNVDINVGHKVARNAISKGDKIIKYGAAIGSATQAIAFGEHVHMHNVKSDYIASHTRQNKVES